MKFGGLTQDNNIIQCADDFDVPANTTWNITSIYTNGSPVYAAATTTIDRYGIIIYNNINGVPEVVLFSDSVTLALEGSNLDTTQTLLLNTPVSLSTGKYWLSVFAIYDTATTIASCRWHWKSGQNNIGETCVLQSTTSLFGSPFSWTKLPTLLGINENSYYFKINGSSNSGITNNPINKINIYPNPSNGSLNITNAENANIIVYNLLGEAVKNISINSAFSTIDLSKLSNGSYIIKVITDKDIFTQTINIVK